MHRGYIKLYRKLFDNPLWSSEPFSRGQAWVDLLILANHKDNFIINRGIRVPIKAGQCGWSVESLAKKWSWSRGKCERFFLMLEMDNQIVRQKNNVCTIITITNWKEYQSNDKAESKASKEASDKADGQQTDTNKNVKKEKKEYNNDFLEFWELLGVYKKGGKKQASTAFTERLKTHTLDDIRSAWLECKKEKKDAELRFYPDTSTFLNSAFETYFDRSKSHNEKLIISTTTIGIEEELLNGTK